MLWMSLLASDLCNGQDPVQIQNQELYQLVLVVIMFYHVCFIMYVLSYVLFYVGSELSLADVCMLQCWSCCLTKATQRVARHE